MLIAYSILLIIMFLLIWESSTLQKKVQTIPLRILVNGTRGKSSVSSYIAVGLNKSGKSAIAKITGVEPTMIYEDGQKKIIKRRSGARVQEQFKIIREAAGRKIEALSLECMSITPEFQKLESRVFKPQFYVITNIKNDHQEKMGSTLEEQAAAVCDAIPFNSTVVTTEDYYIDTIREFAAKRSSQVVQVTGSDYVLTDFPHYVFDENIKLALKVCELAGCNIEVALDGIRSSAAAARSPLSVISSGKKEIHFLDGFDVNDVASAQQFILYWQKETFPDNRLSIFLNTRSDRPIRSVQFAQWIAHTVPNVERVILSGTHVKRTEKELLKAGMPVNRILKIHSHKIDKIRVELLNSVNEDDLVVGLGNIQGLGLEFRKMLAA